MRVKFFNQWAQEIFLILAVHPIFRTIEMMVLIYLINVFSL